MPNMEELISRISRKISEEQEGEIWITKLDFILTYILKYPKNRCRYKGTRGYTVAKTKRWKSETGWLRKQFFIGHRDEICDKRTRATGSSVGTGAFSLICLWKAN